MSLTDTRTLVLPPKLVTDQVLATLEPSARALVAGALARHRPALAPVLRPGRHRAPEPAEVVPSPGERTVRVPLPVVAFAAIPMPLPSRAHGANQPGPLAAARLTGTKRILGAALRLLRSAL